MPPRSLRTIVILVATALVVFLVSSYSHRHLPVEAIQQHLPSLSRLQVPHFEVPQQLQWTTHESDETPSSPSPARYNLSDIWFPQVEKTVEDRLWVPKNNKAMRELLSCMQEGTCRPNQDRVVILGSWFVRDALLPTKFAGEHVWARSIMTALDNLGYTSIFATDNTDIVRIYQMFPSLVVAVIYEPFDLDWCLGDENCIKSDRNPWGIPIWKLLMFTYWSQPKGPLGANWTIVPEPYHKLSRGVARNTYIGYSIENTCGPHAFVPTEERSNSAYFLTKKAQWFFQSWPLDFYTAAAAATGVDFVMGLHDVTARDPDHLDKEITMKDIPFPPGTRDLGALSPSDFLSELSKHKLLIGLGAPVTSPTPYEALCLGVPFINRIRNWDRTNPDDRYSWDAQHEVLKFMDPPYVYNVFRDDKTGFIDAIQSALRTPIEGYVLADMHMSAVTARLQAVLERDLYAMAKEVLDRRKSGEEEDPLFTL
ncbi:unnamed protein product [Peniophora sp. CBMAI 1063]|nr:unnamed protein product [Peniophora sp. CBMAI 1063]